MVAATAAATARDRVLIAAKQGVAMDGSADQLASLVDVAKALSDAEIPYALIGGLAVGIHSQVPRATQDIDIAVISSVSRETITSSLSSAGFELLAEHAHSINFRHVGGEPVQIAIDDAFDAMVERADDVEIGGVSIRVVGKDDLIAMKERSSSDPGRRPSKALRDRADLELLRGDVPDPDEGW